MDWSHLQAKKNPGSFLETLKNYGLTAAAGAGEGVATIEAAAGTFLQAPAANTLAGVMGDIKAAEAMGKAVGSSQSTLQQMGSSIGHKNGVVRFMELQ